jgi:hypothetical protein
MSVGAEIFVGGVLAVFAFCLGVLLVAARRVDEQAAQKNR